MSKSKRGTKLLAMVLCVAMALSLLWVPALGAAPMMGETAVAETVPENVGTMPEVPVRHPAAEEPGELSAETPPVQTWTSDDPSNTFFHVTCTIQPEKEGEAPKYSVDYGGVHYTHNAKLASGTNITFTIPDNQSGTFSMVIKTRAGSTKEANFNLDGTVIPLTSTDVMLYTNKTLAPGTHTITRAKKEADIYMLQWAPDHTCEWTEQSRTEPTCTTDGKVTYKCTVPGCTKTKEETLGATGHTEAVIPAVPANCVTDGKSAGKKCSVCDIVLQEPTVVKATGQHTWGANGKCTVCQLEQSHSHTFGEWVTNKEPDCVNQGEKTRKCKDFDKCGGIETEVLTALGHDIVQVSEKTPVCASNGYAAYEYCKRDGCDYTTKKVTPHVLNPDGTCKVCGQLVSKPLTNAGGWFESLYAVLPGMKDADVSAVSYSGTMSGELTGEDLEYLVRDTADGVRVDIPGIPAGTYTLKVTANDTVYEATGIEVMEHDRSGYAHYKYTDGVGAYRDDGILKENAIVLYVTNENKDTVSVSSSDGTTVTGIGHILNTAGMDVGGGVTSKGGKANNNAGIMKKLAEDGTPLVVRIVGAVKNPAGTTVFDSVDYGGSVGDNGAMVRMKDARNITIEGIGPDAVVDGWGIHFMAGSAYQDGGKSFEVRNLSFKNVPEDCIGMEGVQEGSTLTASVERCWIHNCAFYKPTIANPAESDKDGGDGACDFKRGQYMTMDYCYYDGYHKTNLVGASNSNLQFNITWHHNWWKNCESRGPLGRQANMHIYNCLYDGQTSYAQNTRADCYIFSEYNTFLNCKAPRDVAGGAIKSYHDSLSSCINDSGATTVTDKTQKVNSNNKYANFDTNSDICYIPSGDYKLDTDHAVAQANIKAYAGPMKAQPIKPEDVSGSTVVTDRVPTTALSLPYDKAINSTIATAASGTFDNIVFNNVKPSSDNVKYGKDSVGQYVVFKVDQRVDVTLDGTASVLVNSAGNTVADIPGSATNLPAGIYYVQPNSIQPAKGDAPMTYKEGTLAHLTVVPTKVTTPPHAHSWDAGKVTEPTCTREGVRLYTCTDSTCHETKSEFIGKVDHVYVGGACQWCGLMEGTLGGEVSGEVIPVSDLTLDTTDVTVMQGDSVRVIATVSPSNASKKTVTWKSNDTNVATVAKNGTITGKGSGTTTVTATAGDITKTVNVKVIGVQTDTYTFSAKADGPAQVQDTSKGEDPVADASKWGTNQYFTNKGSGNKWKAKDLKKKDMTTSALLLASQGSSSLGFTVMPKAKAKVTLSFSSTSSTNRSALALRNSAGELVPCSDGNLITVCLGTGATSVMYENLPEGDYEIIVPSNVKPDDVNPEWTSFPDATKDDPNTRGAKLVSATVVESTATDGNIVEVTGVTLDKTSVTLEVNGTETIRAAVAPNNATIKTVTWASSDNSVATVVGGVITGRKVGTATITATSGSKSATCAVTVNAAEPDSVKVRSITISGDDKVEIHQTLTLTANVLPDEADNKTVSWSSSDAKIATVSAAGVVTAEAPGTVTITAAATDGSGVKATKTITVEDTYHDADTLGDNAEYHWSVTKGGKLDMTGSGAVSGDSFYAATWDKDGKFLGVKIIDATAASLSAQLDSSWAHLKLIWANAQQAPKCQAAETNK